jgi:isopentenyldiphosphate isomerase
MDAKGCCPESYALCAALVKRTPGCHHGRMSTPSNAGDEIFDVVDESGRVIGQAPRSRCHGDPSLIHPSVHVLVFSPDGRLFLQKRSMTKDTQPGKWDTSVGGHLKPGEPPEEAARREMDEELGIREAALRAAYEYIWRSSFETELIRAFGTVYDGPIRLDPAELEDGKFWALADIERQLDSGVFTPQLAHEFPRMLAWWQNDGRSIAGRRPG